MLGKLVYDWAIGWVEQGEYMELVRWVKINQQSPLGGITLNRTHWDSSGIEMGFNMI